MLLKPLHGFVQLLLAALRQRRIACPGAGVQGGVGLQHVANAAQARARVLPALLHPVGNQAVVKAQHVAHEALAPDAAGADFNDFRLLRKAAAAPQRAVFQVRHHHGAAARLQQRLDGRVALQRGPAALAAVAVELPVHGLRRKQQRQRRRGHERLFLLIGRQRLHMHEMRIGRLRQPHFRARQFHQVQRRAFRGVKREVKRHARGQAASGQVFIQQRRHRLVA